MLTHPSPRRQLPVDVSCCIRSQRARLVDRCPERHRPARTPTSRPAQITRAAEQITDVFASGPMPASTHVLAAHAPGAAAVRSMTSQVIAIDQDRVEYVGTRSRSPTTTTSGSLFVDESAREGPAQDQARPVVDRCSRTPRRPISLAGLGGQTLATSKTAAPSHHCSDAAKITSVDQTSVVLSPVREPPVGRGLRQLVSSAALISISYTPARRRHTARKQPRAASTALKSERTSSRWRDRIRDHRQRPRQEAPRRSSNNRRFSMLDGADPEQLDSGASRSTSSANPTGLPAASSTFLGAIPRRSPRRSPRWSRQASGFSSTTAARRPAPATGRGHQPRPTPGPTPSPKSHSIHTRAPRRARRCIILSKMTNIGTAHPPAVTSCIASARNGRLRWAGSPRRRCVRRPSRRAGSGTSSARARLDDASRSLAATSSIASRASASNWARRRPDGPSTSCIEMTTPTGSGAPPFRCPARR